MRWVVSEEGWTPTRPWLWALMVWASARQDPKMRERLDPDEIGQRLANFINASAEELKILTMLSGHGDVRELSEEDLRALDVDTAAITGLKLVGYERALPWWENGYAK